ncbi:mitochondrial large subunit ribosomal protein-domain-containing protein [Morchella snyderi]|nr:mitochondrial large subunit ribosomal protein-domain-containing protein [Morchella snyderi]
MLYTYPPPITLRVLRSQLLRQARTAHFTTTTRRAEEITPRSQSQLPYFIHRTKTNNLPVYEELRGSNKKETRIRKVDGDLNALRGHVINHLGIDKELVSINGRTRHVIIKGWFKKDLSSWLQGLRF